MYVDHVHESLCVLKCASANVGLPTRALPFASCGPALCCVRRREFLSESDDRTARADGEAGYRESALTERARWKLLWACGVRFAAHIMGHFAIALDGPGP